MDTAAFIEYLENRPGYDGQIVHVEHIPERAAVYGRLENPLPRGMEKVLREKHLFPLYTHQAAAINIARKGQPVMVSTPSASGKSLCYNIPVVEALLSEAWATALYLFPTKALAQDQMRSILDTYSPELIDYQEVATFDGDTPVSERNGIKKRARLIITNPDMLHLGIIPNHASWERLLRHLKFVVLDEAHVYRGVFGSHVALVLRRLRRLCRQYGSEPAFIFCSATIDNPAEHASRLAGLPFSVVKEDGSPHGSKDFVFWNPPLLDEIKSTRKSSNSEAAAIFTELVSRGIRTLAFTRTRRLVELVANYARQRLSEISVPLSKRVKAYRAGYLPKERRQIEQELFSGILTGVVATTALELGIDIGDLEATVLTGYPGTIASTWQQAGRSGRGKSGSLSFLVALDNPLDQYLMRHPSAFFQKACENALVNPENRYILRSHLLCAAWERPLAAEDEEFFGRGLLAELALMEVEGLLRLKRDRYYLSPAVSLPAAQINIRSASGESFAVFDAGTNSLLETVEADNAIFHLHPGAVYLHQGDTYLVTSLDLEGRMAMVQQARVNYYTVTKELTDIRILKPLAQKNIGQVGVNLGEVEITTTVTGFKKKMQYTEEVIGEEQLDLPPRVFSTVSLWFDIPAGVIETITRGGMDFAGGIHAAEHAAIGILPLFAMCDRNDIGGVSTPFHADTGRAQIFIYDACPGGVGIAEKGYEIIKELWRTTLQTVSECPCQDGCPSCVQSPKCGNNNKPLDKKAARVLLKGLLANK